MIGENRRQVTLRLVGRPFAIVLVCLLTGCYGERISYFPLPESGRAVVRSEAQAFVVDTLFADLVRPYSMAFLPDGTVLITERRGHLLVVRDGRVRETLVGGNVPTELRDFALHPAYQRNGWIYLSYYVEPTEDEPGWTSVMRARLEGSRLVDDQPIYSAGPFREGAEWYGSRIEFDAEGHLYVTVGQRYLWGTPRTRGQFAAWPGAQDLSSPSGKTMRLRDDGSIPPDNPFVGTPGALPEIFTYGHRQHQGLVRHPLTGEIWSTEHGEMGGSELNLLRSGFNYGWPLATFSLNYDSTHIADPYGDGLEPPVHHWTPSIAPSGLDFVVGGRYPGWEGDLMVASLVGQMLVRSVFVGDRVVHDEKLLQGIGRVRSVRLAPDGYLYLLVEDPGMLVRLLPAD
jgi:aldose sugar dehydrogenase